MPGSTLLAAAKRPAVKNFSRNFDLKWHFLKKKKHFSSFLSLCSTNQDFVRFSLLYFEL